MDYTTVADPGLFLRGCASMGNGGDYGQKTCFEVVSAHFWIFAAGRNFKKSFF
jgi:hypothetical protein